MKKRYLAVLITLAINCIYYFNIDVWSYWLRMNQSWIYSSTEINYDPFPYIFTLFKISIFIYLGRLTAKYYPHKDKIFSNELYPIN